MCRKGESIYIESGLTDADLRKVVQTFVEKLSYALRDGESAQPTAALNFGDLSGTKIDLCRNKTAQGMCLFRESWDMEEPEAH